MPRSPKSVPRSLVSLQKVPTGIRGLDDITGGGLPKGRTTIICGGPGCGKTTLGIEFLVRGAREFDEPGVLMAFEEAPHEIAMNVASLGFNLEELSEKKKLFLDYVYMEPSEIHDTGDYDLEGLFIRLQNAVDSVGAKRVVLDTVEALFSSFKNEGLLRAEFRRLFRWLKDRGLTAVITAEQGEETLTRYRLEEYVSDCVILLDHRVRDQISARRMRIVKYRGTKHGADEYPFLITEQGVSVLPLTSLTLQHKASSERVASGITALDQMMESKGYFRGSTILVSGTAGTGKSALAASFAAATCGRGERCLYIGFEESASQMMRNMKSIGLDFEPWVEKGLFFHEAWRPTQFGLEMHLLRIHQLVEKVKPSSVVLDPITHFISSSEKEVESMLTRLIDSLKEAGITGFFVSLTQGDAALEKTAVGISSLADTWILLRSVELNGEKNRCLYVLKSRGMAHSNQLREFVLSSQGIDLVPAYLGNGAVLTGSSRVAQEAREKADAVAKEQELQRKVAESSKKRLALRAQIAALEAELSAEEEAIQQVTSESREQKNQLEADRDAMAKRRGTQREDAAREIVGDLR